MLCGTFQVFEYYVEENICTTSIYKPGSLTNTKPRSNLGKSARLHKELRAHESIDFSGGEIKGGGYIWACGLANVLNVVVGKSIGLHKDLWAHKCGESSGKEIDRVT
jgi:hypothetical protein